MSEDERAESPNRNTLRRWWKGRDTSQDERLRAVQVQTRSEVVKRGGLTQLQGMLGVLQMRMQTIIEDEAAWADTELALPQKTQAAMNMTRALALAAPLLGTGETEETTNESKASRFAERCKRTAG